MIFTILIWNRYGGTPWKNELDQWITMGNSSPPSYTEKPEAAVHDGVMKNYEIKLRCGTTVCSGHGLEPFDIVAKPSYIAILYKNKDIYMLEDLERNNWYVRLLSNRVIKAFKALLSVKVRPGNYDVNINFRRKDTNAIVHVIHCKMDHSSYKKLSRAIQDLQNHVSDHYFGTGRDYDWISSGATIIPETGRVTYSDL